MSELIGQRRIKHQFDSYVKTEKIPRFIILTGQKGQGKKTLAFYLASALGASVYMPKDLKVDDIREMIEDAQTLHEKRVYLMSDADSMTVQAQNALLKLVEQPPTNALFVMTIESDSSILPTIHSRSYIHQLAPYTKEELATKTDNPLILDACSNFGQIERSFQYDIEKMHQFADKIVSNISAINTANAFNIVKHFDIEDTDLLIGMIQKVFSDKLKSSKDMAEIESLFKKIKVLYKYKYQLKNKSINKSNALEMMFVEMREA